MALFLLPLWLFVLVALFAYFVPYFKPASLFVPFVAGLWILSVLPQGLFLGLLAVTFFFLIFGIKDLKLIERDDWHEALLVLIFLPTAISFFQKFDSPASPRLFWGILGFAVLLVLVLGSFLRTSEATRKNGFSLYLGVLLLVEWLVVLVYLPINHFYQTALFLLGLIIFIEMLISLPTSLGSSRRGLGYSAVMFLGILLVLFAADWSV